MLDMGMNPNIYALIGFISIVLEGIVGIIVSSYPDKEMTVKSKYNKFFFLDFYDESNLKNFEFIILFID